MATASRGKLSATRAAAWCACAGALAALALVLPAPAAGETGRKWQPHVDAIAKLGGPRKVGKLDIFLPLLQGQNGLLFADLRGVLTDDPSHEGNFGLGYRHIFRNNDWLYGADFALGFYAFYDRRRSLTDKIFNQATVGAEFLTVDWDFRVNGYIPQNQAKIVGFSFTGTVALVGTALFTTAGTTTVREQALPGFDIEAGRRLALTRNHELWLHAGYFRFARQATIAVQGPRLRLEYRYDNPFGWRGARITLGGEARHDAVRRTDVFGIARLRIPLDGLFFGGSRKTRAPRLVGIDRRMDEYVVRDTDIVSLATGATTVVTPGGPGSVPVTDAGSGTPINVFFIDGTAGNCTQADPCTMATVNGGAQGTFDAGDVVVPVDPGGNITDDIALAAARQQIVGGGATGTAALVFTDAAASTLALAGLGARATLNGQVTLFLDANVRGFDIDNAGGNGMIATTNLGLASANVSDMGIRGSGNGVFFNGATGTANFNADVAVTGTAGGAAVNIVGGNGTVNFNGTITQAANRAVDVTDRTGGTVTFTGAINQTGISTGISVANNSGGAIINFSGAISLNTGPSSAVGISNNTGATINFTGGGLVTVNTGGTGIFASGGGTINITGAGNTVTTTTGVGVDMNGVAIGTGGVTFQSVNTGAGANSIVLTNVTDPNTTGFAVTGTGAADSGGTMAAPIAITNSPNVRLTDINVNVAAGAMTGTGNLAGLVLNRVTLTSASGVPLALTNFSGKVTVQNGSTLSSLGAAGNDGIRASNTGLTASLDIDDTTITAGALGDGVDADVITAGTLTLRIAGSMISSTSALNGLDLQSGGVAFLNATVTGTTITGASLTRGIFVDTSSSNVCLNASGNTLPAGGFSLTAVVGSITVPQADSAAIAAANNGAAVTINGALSFSQPACPVP